MTMDEYETYEEDRMKHNAWYVAEEITRIDDAPVLSTCIAATLSSPLEDQFYFNEDHLQQYQKATSSQAKTAVPGSTYIEKIVELC